jgi:hypothetical protein
MNTGDILYDQAILTGLATFAAIRSRTYKDEARTRFEKLNFLIRDSTIYRADAIHWHCSLLETLQRGASDALHRSCPAPDAPREILERTHKEQQFVFDDVMFNSVALFDYVGNWIGFALYGDQRRKAKWGRILKYAQDQKLDAKDNGKPRVFGHPIGTKVKDTENEFLRPLADYRAALIHYETIPAGGTVSTNFTNKPDGSAEVGHELTVSVPKPFADELTVPGFEGEPAKAPLIDAARWIETETRRRAASLLHELESALSDEVSRRSDVER